MSNPTLYPTSADFEKGDEAIVVANGAGHEFPDGALIRIVGFDSDGDARWKCVDSATRETYGTYWYVRRTDIRSTNPAQEAAMTENTTPARPLVDFSGESRRTAREYAAAANSRVLTEASQKVLKAASLGQQVDAYALNGAITDAMRSTATRLGQSMARRDLGKKVAYLGHITQAVLENHADGLPAYPEGERSRVAFEARQEVADVQRALDHQGEVNQSLTRDLTTLKQAASDERRRLCGEINEKGAEVQRLLEIGAARDEIIVDTTAKLQDAERERAILGAVVGYVLESLDGEGKARVLGYWDGVKDGVGSTES